MDIIKTQIKEDARQTFQDLSYITGINSSPILKILCRQLGIQKLCALWIPHLPTDAERAERARMAEDLLKQYGQIIFRSLSEITSGDET